MIWTLLPGAVFLADGGLKKKAEEELKENEQIPVCKGHIVLRKCCLLYTSDAADE